MKSFVYLLVFVVACTAQSTGGGGGGGGGGGCGGGGGGGSGIGSGGQTDDCFSDECVCPTTEGCSHACTPGGPPCHVQCTPGETCNIVCDAAEECHVEAIASTIVDVDCHGSPECHVTCPQTGCTVHNCIGESCVVSCGAVGAATRNGTTATCP